MQGGATLFPGHVFDGWLRAWRSRKPSTLAASAGLKDALALLEEAPTSLPAILPDFDNKELLLATVVDTVSFLRHSFIPMV